MQRSRSRCKSVSPSLLSRRDRRVIPDLHQGLRSDADLWQRTIRIDGDPVNTLETASIDEMASFKLNGDREGGGSLVGLESPFSMERGL